MKSRVRELVDKGVAAMISAIEIYNKPDFKYREETFSILAINAWELLLKAKWLKLHDNKLRSLYVFESHNRPNGQPYKYPKIKETRCGNPFTHSMDFLVSKLLEEKCLSQNTAKNLAALTEIRDSSVHFYNNNKLFALQLQEVGSATVKNFVSVSRDWFSVDLTEFNFYLMPLAFVSTDSVKSGILLNTEEKRLATFISSLEAANDPSSDDSVTVNIELKFEKSKAVDAMSIQLTNDPEATKVQLSEQQIKDRYPLNYKMLTEECRSRYTDFKQVTKYHDLRKDLKLDKKYCIVRRLDPDNPASAKQEWFSRAIFTVLDRHYTKC